MIAPDEYLLCTFRLSVVVFDAVFCNDDNRDGERVIRRRNRRRRVCKTRRRRRIHQWCLCVARCNHTLRSHTFIARWLPWLVRRL